MMLRPKNEINSKEYDTNCLPCKQMVTFGDSVAREAVVPAPDDDERISLSQWPASVSTRASISRWSSDTDGNYEVLKKN